MPIFLTINELADLLKVERMTIYNWRKRGMPHIKIGSGDKAPVRFEQDKVLAWLEQQNKEA